jgi:alcohol dehydrogenase
MIARAHGAKVIAVDIREEALKLARELGADAVVRAQPEIDLPGLIRELSGGGAHLSLDALGSRVTFENSIRSLRKRGRHVQIGLLAGEESDPPTPMSEVIANELEILGSHGMQASRYDAIFELIDAGKIQPENLVRKRVTLNQAPDELRGMGEYHALGMTVIELP